MNVVLFLYFALGATVFAASWVFGKLWAYAEKKAEEHRQKLKKYGEEKTED